jgi:hypothetical protein
MESGHYRTGDKTLAIDVAQQHSLQWPNFKCLAIIASPRSQHRSIQQGYLRHRKVRRNGNTHQTPETRVLTVKFTDHGLQFEHAILRFAGRKVSLKMIADKRIVPESVPASVSHELKMMWYICYKRI